MMKRYIIGLITVFAFLAVSCHRELKDDAKGYVYLNIGHDQKEEVIVKAAEPVTTPYIVEIYNSAGLLHKVTDHRTLTADSPLELLIGTYTVKAMNREFANESFHEYFSAERQIRVLPEQTLMFDMTCVRSDVRFSVEFPVEFSELFKRYEVRVTNGTGNELILSNSPDQNDPCQASLSDIASFDVTGQLSWSLYLKNIDSADDNNVGGIYITDTKTYQNVKAGDHYHLKFDLAEPEEIDGVFALRVVVNGETIEELHNIQIDFDQEGKPSCRANEGFDIPTELGEYMTVIFESPTDKYLTFETPVGLKHLYVSHYDEDLTRLGLPHMTDLYKGTQSQKDVLTVLGIAHNVAATRSVVNLTNFIKILPQGVYDFTVTAIDTKGRYAKCHLPIEIVLDVDAEAASCTPWAEFAYVEARYFSSPAPEGLTFQYRNALDTEWLTLSASKVEINQNTMRYSARIDGLEAGTNYVFRAASANDIAVGKESKEISFTTETAPVISNLSFDDWYQDDSVWYPNVNSSNFVWDTANEGTSSLSVYPTEPETSHLAPNTNNQKAAKLMSKSVTMVGLAAGNIYTGDFIGAKISLTNPGAELDWGTQFNGRPIALRGYYDYRPGTVDVANSPYSDMNGKSDIGQVQMILTGWDKKFRINTQTKTFVKVDEDEDIIAYGTMDLHATSDYVRFTIPLQYRDIARIPTYVVVVGSASKYGDYYTGSTSSVLYLDEFEFVYDPAELTPAEFEKVFSNIN